MEENENCIEDNRGNEVLSESFTTYAQCEVMWYFPAVIVQDHKGL